MGDFNHQREDLVKYGGSFNVRNESKNRITFRSMISKEQRRIDFVFNKKEFEAGDAEDYDHWTWNISDHMPIQADFDLADEIRKTGVLVNKKFNQEVRRII